jgi:hypothetical protein
MLCRKLIALGLNSTVYTRFDSRGIALKALADEIGVTAFHASEIVNREGISDRVVEPHGQEPVAPLVRRNPPKLTRIPPQPGCRGFQRRRVKAIAERIGRDHRESFPAHNFSSPEWKTLKQLAYL